MHHLARHVQMLTPGEMQLRLSIALNLRFIATIDGGDRKLHVYHTLGCDVMHQVVSRSEFGCGQGYANDRNFKGQGDPLNGHATMAIWTDPQTGEAGYDHIAL